MSPFHPSVLSAPVSLIDPTTDFSVLPPFSNNSFCCALNSLGFCYNFVYVCACTYVTVYRQRSEDNIWESVLYFHYGGPRAQTQVLKLGHLYPLSHLASPDFLLLLLFCILMFSALFWEHFSVIHPQFSSGLLSQRQFCPYDEVGHV